jgi:hypothetical protein
MYGAAGGKASPLDDWRDNNDCSVAAAQQERKNLVVELRGWESPSHESVRSLCARNGCAITER